MRAATAKSVCGLPDVFSTAKITVAKIVTRTGKPPFEGMPMTLETGGGGGQIFSKPLAVLIDERTASTAELVSNALQETGRAKIFGTNSCGCVLAFLDYKPLAGGGDMTLSEFGFITPKNRRLEGAGVLPDKSVPLKLKDLQNNLDKTLEQAEEFLISSLDAKIRYTLNSKFLTLSCLGDHGHYLK